MVRSQTLLSLVQHQEYPVYRPLFASAAMCRRLQTRSRRNREDVRVETRSEQQPKELCAVSIKQNQQSLELNALSVFVLVNKLQFLFCMLHILCVLPRNHPTAMP